MRKPTNEARRKIEGKKSRKENKLMNMKMRYHVCLACDMSKARAFFSMRQAEE